MKLFLDWSSYANAGVGDAYADIPKQGEDFAKAVAVCINSRQCQSKPKGVMCPSFRVSDEALYSTGGRVQLLKQALNAEEPLLALLDEKLARTMELCVACKACKRECENEVDMAMLKIEYLAQKQLHLPISRRNRFFADLPEHLQNYPWLGKLIALHNRLPWLRKLNEKLLGINSQLALPQTQAAQAIKANHNTKTDKAVALFIDTFSRHFAPEQAKAAVSVLEKAGYTVHVIQAQSDKKLCCGRTQLAHGRISAAKKAARKVLQACAPYVKQGMPILGLEPACLLAIRDDYKFLGLGEQADQTASLAILFEEFIAREKVAGRFQLQFRSLKQEDKLLVHGHCHQKAVGAMKSMRKVLKMIPQLEFELIESSCCGMAGSFGLEKEHARESKDMAEQSLLPRLRQSPQSDIVANGFSCRHQISHGVQRQARHIAQILDEASD